MTFLNVLRPIGVAIVLSGLAGCDGHGSASQPPAATSSQVTSAQEVNSARPEIVFGQRGPIRRRLVASGRRTARGGATGAAERSEAEDGCTGGLGIGVMRDFYAAGKHQGVQFAPRDWSGPEPDNDWTDTTLEAVNGGEFAVVRACSPFMACFRMGGVSLPNNAELTLKVDFDDHPGASAPVDVIPSKCGFAISDRTLTYPCADLLDGRTSVRIRSALLNALAEAAANRAASS